MTAAEFDQSITRTLWVAMLYKGVPVYLLDWKNYRHWLDSSYYDGNIYNKEGKVDPSNYPITTFTNADHDSYWDYYGGDPVPSEYLMRQFLTEDSGINWAAMQEPSDNHELEFMGTEEPSSEIPTMRGVLIFNNGNSYPWVSKLKVDLQHLKDLLAFMKEYESKTDEEVIQHVKAKFQRLLESPDSY